jgi:hypothetical protein
LAKFFFGDLQYLAILGLGPPPRLHVYNIYYSSGQKIYGTFCLGVFEEDRRQSMRKDNALPTMDVEQFRLTEQCLCW